MSDVWSTRYRETGLFDGLLGFNRLIDEFIRLIDGFIRLTDFIRLIDGLISLIDGLIRWLLDEEIIILFDGLLNKLNGMIDGWIRKLWLLDEWTGKQMGLSDW